MQRRILLLCSETSKTEKFILMTHRIIAFMVLAIFFVAAPLYPEQIYSDSAGNEIRIAVVDNWGDINQAQSQDILVKSFMTAYEDVPLLQLSEHFRSTGDVRRFYKNYFFEELEHYKNGHLFWVEAFFNDRLVGWATFELEPNEPNAAYMNLLAVDPEYQQKGLGRYLTFSICSEDLFPDINAINLLIRKVNTEGYKFYYKLGFSDYEYQRDNFVDSSLLTGLRWQR